MDPTINPRVPPITPFTPSNISFVFQNAKLFNKSIYENVKMGNENATYQDVMKALKNARCDDILSKFKERENTIMRYIGLSKKSMIFMYIKESVFWAIVSGAIMFGIVLFKSIYDYLVNIKYQGDGYKMVFSFETISLATLYVSVLFALVYIVVLKKRIEE